MFIFKLQRSVSGNQMELTYEIESSFKLGFIKIANVYNLNTAVEDILVK